MRRAVRYGDAWHPNRLRLAWFRDTGIPRLREIAEREGRPAPALCPRIRLRLTDAPLDDTQRIIGEGTLAQVRHDLEALHNLGCKAILLDTYYDDVEATRYNETAWRMLTVMAEQALDLPRQTLK